MSVSWKQIAEAHCLKAMAYSERVLFPFLLLLPSTHVTITTSRFQIHFMFLAGIEERKDIVFAIDSSNSVNDTMFRRMKKLVKATLGSFKFSPSDSRGAIVGFGSQPQLANNLYEGTDARTIELTVDRLSKIGGVKGMKRVLRMIRTDIFGNPVYKVSNAKRVVMLFTTGNNTSDSAGELEKTALELRSEGVDVIPVVIGTESDQKKLDAIAGKSATPLFVDDARNLPVALGPLEAKIREAGGMATFAYNCFFPLLLAKRILTIICYFRRSI